MSTSAATVPMVPAAWTVAPETKGIPHRVAFSVAETAVWLGFMEYGTKPGSDAYRNACQRVRLNVQWGELQQRTIGGKAYLIPGDAIRKYQRRVQVDMPVDVPAGRDAEDGTPLVAALWESVPTSEDISPHETYTVPETAVWLGFMERGVQAGSRPYQAGCQRVRRVVHRDEMQTRAFSSRTYLIPGKSLCEYLSQWDEPITAKEAS